MAPPPTCGADEMTTIADILQGAIDAAFDIQGIDATYTPVAGSPLVIKVIPSEEDELVDVPGISSRIQTETNLFDVRVSEIAAPAQNDSLVVSGTTYTVASTTQKDARKLIWQLDVRGSV